MLWIISRPDFFIWLIMTFLVLTRHLTKVKVQHTWLILTTTHLQLLDKAFKYLLKAGLKIKLNKCSFFKEQINYLGHLVSGTSIHSLANKIEVLMKLKLPTNIKEVRHFLRLNGYYQKFICNYVDVDHPLNCLMHKSQPFVWTQECQSMF